MNELLVMRHAKSDWGTGHSDFHRPLNGRGVRSAERMANWVFESDLTPDQVISSPAERARATAMQVVYACDVDRASVDFLDELYLADVGGWLAILAQQTCGRLLICGHNPGLDDLVDCLSAPPAPLSATGKLMTTAAIAHLGFERAWSEITPGSGQLISLMRPRELRSPD